MRIQKSNLNSNGAKIVLSKEIIKKRAKTKMIQII